MKWLPTLVLPLLCWLALPVAGWSQDDQAPADERPVLVELFTSQGCGLCPEANRYLGELDQRANVFVLAYAVSYWDMYGWTDTYARPEYVQRQRTYLPRLDVPRLYTPHFVVDGVTDSPGWEQDAVAEAVSARLSAMPDSPVISVADGPFGSFRVTLDGAAPEEDLDVWLIAYAPGWATVEVGAGENEGLNMLHYNMVKSLTYLGNWSGGPASFTGESFRRYGTVAIVQGANGGPVYGYARVAPSDSAPR
ncbi:hypothetical protein AWH62_05845 [Maricaulis sp. W15]|uniref:DUF1223 domain-containing protein n=1 Tax=Maricaulis sp. W15 TaxID=1772333 RepID=UPI000948ABB9|nr:DUF1223 domain-containing protein [Maricaulis sp. W15]OLF75343.1 hypothetical protein AWH62_05845 [Maricaulis sp. W15]